LDFNAYEEILTGKPDAGNLHVRFDEGEWQEGLALQVPPVTLYSTGLNFKYLWLEFRISICDLVSRSGNPGRSHDGGQFAGLVVQRLNLILAQQAAVDDQFHPIRRFVRIWDFRFAICDLAPAWLWQTGQSKIGNRQSTMHKLDFETTASSGAVILCFSQKNSFVFERRQYAWIFNRKSQI